LFAAPRWRNLGGIVLLVWLALAGHSTKKMVRAYHLSQYAISYTQLRDTVVRHCSGRPVAALTRHREPFSVLNLISGETGVEVVAVQAEQQRIVQSHTLGKSSDGTQGATDGTLFQGLVLVDQWVLATGQDVHAGTLLKFDCDKVVTTLGALTLCEGRIYVHAPSLDQRAAAVIPAGRGAEINLAAHQARP
jgi:hypothetical protein